MSLLGVSARNNVKMGSWLFSTKIKKDFDVGVFLSSSYPSSKKKPIKLTSDVSVHTHFENF